MSSLRTALTQIVAELADDPFALVGGLPSPVYVDVPAHGGTVYILVSITDPDQRYIGVTTRPLSVRLAEHNDLLVGGVLVRGQQRPRRLVVEVRQARDTNELEAL